METRGDRSFEDFSIEIRKLSLEAYHLQNLPGSIARLNEP
jgi:hypothetical protein